MSELSRPGYEVCNSPAQVFNELLSTLPLQSKTDLALKRVREDVVFSSPWLVLRGPSELVAVSHALSKLIAPSGELKPRILELRIKLDDRSPDTRFECHAVLRPFCTLSLPIGAAKYTKLIIGSVAGNLESKLSQTADSRLVSINYVAGPRNAGQIRMSSLLRPSIRKLVLFSAFAVRTIEPQQYGLLIRLAAFLFLPLQLLLLALSAYQGKLSASPRQTGTPLASATASGFVTPLAEARSTGLPSQSFTDNKTPFSTPTQIKTTGEASLEATAMKRSSSAVSFASPPEIMGQVRIEKANTASAGRQHHDRRKRVSFDHLQPIIETETPAAERTFTILQRNELPSKSSSVVWEREPSNMPHSAEKANEPTAAGKFIQQAEPKYIKSLADTVDSIKLRRPNNHASSSMRITLPGGATLAGKAKRPINRIPPPHIDQPFLPTPPVQFPGNFSSETDTPTRSPSLSALALMTGAEDDAAVIREMHTNAARPLPHVAHPAQFQAPAPVPFYSPHMQHDAYNPQWQPAFGPNMVPTWPIYDGYHPQMTDSPPTPLYQSPQMHMPPTFGPHGHIYHPDQMIGLPQFPTHPGHVLQSRPSTESLQHEWNAPPHGHFGTQFDPHVNMHQNFNPQQLFEMHQQDHRFSHRSSQPTTGISPATAVISAPELRALWSPAEADPVVANLLDVVDKSPNTLVNASHPPSLCQQPEQEDKTKAGEDGKRGPSRRRGNRKGLQAKSSNASLSSHSSTTPGLASEEKSGAAYADLTSTPQPRKVDAKRVVPGMPNYKR